MCSRNAGDEKCRWWGGVRRIPPSFIDASSSNSTLLFASGTKGGHVCLYDLRQSTYMEFLVLRRGKALQIGVNSIVPSNVIAEKSGKGCLCTRCRRAGW